MERYSILVITLAFVGIIAQRQDVHKACSNSVQHRARDTIATNTPHHKNEAQPIIFELKLKVKVAAPQLRKKRAGQTVAWKKSVQQMIKNRRRDVNTLTVSMIRASSLISWETGFG